MHREILATLRRAEELAFLRAEFEDRLIRQKFWRMIEKEFAALFEGCDLRPHTEKWCRLEGLWVRFMQDPGHILYLYHTLAYELTGQINFDLFREVIEQPREPHARKHDHLTVVK